MGSTKEFADFVLEQLDGIGELSVRRMFGEYALYVDGLVVGFICDDQLFIKPVTEALNLLDDEPVFAPAYPGSKDYVLVTFLESAELVGKFVRTTADHLPPSPPKRHRPQRQ